MQPFQLTPLDLSELETPSVLRAVAEASRQLAELKGVAAAIPNERVLLSALALQEAKDSSAIENIVTTHDELFRQVSGSAPANPAAKEVLRYREALQEGFELVRQDGLLTGRHLQRVQAVLEQSHAGYRRVPGTTLRDGAGRVVYTPPQDHSRIIELMADLDQLLNAPWSVDVDPLVRMAVIHHRFESIHPFYDGNGRTGRILNVLYLVKEGLLDSPVLFMSRHIVRTKGEYYRLLQAVRDAGAWQDWVLYMLTAVMESARQGVSTVKAIRGALLEAKHEVRQDLRRVYSQDLINHLFSHPYTTVAALQHALGVSRVTATSYLRRLVEIGVLTRLEYGRFRFYVNSRLVDVLTAPG